MVRENNQTEHVRELCSALKPLIGEQAERIWTVYLLEDREGKRELAEYLELVASTKLAGGVDSRLPVLLPPPSAQASGRFRFGDVTYNNRVLYPFGLGSSEMLQHVGIFGRSGSGKTNLGLLTVRNLVAEGIPFLIFDWKRNYRDLITMQGFQQLRVYTVGRNIASLRFNPLIPPAGTHPRVWMKKLIEVIAHAFFLGDGVIYLLQTAIDHVYREAGVYGNPRATYPTFRDVLAWLKEYPAKGRELGWMTSTLRAISSLCFGEMDRIVNAENNEGLQDLLKHQVVLELEALAQSDKVFFVETLILWIHHYRMARNQREQFTHSLILEEAHHILSSGRRNLSGGESIMDVLFREIREFGEGIVVLDQHPSEISLAALGNTYCTIAMNLKSRADVSVMAGIMLLKPEQKDVLGRLGVGEAAVKLQGRTPDAFTIRIPEMPIRKGIVTDAMIADHMAGHLRPDKPLAAPPINVPADARAFLTDVKLMPQSGVAARYRRLGMSGRQGDRLKRAFIEQGLVEEQIQSTETGRTNFLRLTERGIHALEGGTGMGTESGPRELTRREWT